MTRYQVPRELGEETSIKFTNIGEQVYSECVLSQRSKTRYIFMIHSIIQLHLCHGS